MPKVSRWRWLGPAALAAATLGGGTAQAIDIYFFLLPGNFGTVKSLQCEGPWGRSSGCKDIPNPFPSSWNFYRAEDNIFSPYGTWTCKVSRDQCGIFATTDASTDVCVSRKEGVLAEGVTLTITGAPSIKSDGWPAGECSLFQTTSVLGHVAGGGAAAAADRAPSGSRNDVDTFTWRGRGGAPLSVRVERDPAGGSVGERARVEVVGDGGRVLGHDGGALPLEVKATVPPSGVFHVVVEEAPRAPDRGAGGAAPAAHAAGSASDGRMAFRGHYRLSVDAPGILRDRTLEPQRDVEH